MDAFSLKIIALVLMFLEHFSYYLSDFFPPMWPLFFRYLGRIVAPIFFFLAVESFFKTKNQKKYILRLYLWALIMEIGNILAEESLKYLLPSQEILPLRQNIFLSLATGVNLIFVLQTLKNKMAWDKRLLYYWGIFLLIFFGLASEASFIGLGMILIFYFCYKDKVRTAFFYALFSLSFVLFGLIFDPLNFWQSHFQWMMLGALPLFFLYNGQRGKYQWKYFFYAFYPLHVWILYVLKGFLK